MFITFFVFIIINDCKMIHIKEYISLKIEYSANSELKLLIKESIYIKSKKQSLENFESLNLKIL